MREPIYYRIRIEELDYEGNLLTQSQAQFSSYQIEEMKQLGIDTLEIGFKQLLEKHKEYKQYEQNKSR